MSRSNEGRPEGRGLRCVVVFVAANEVRLEVAGGKQRSHGGSAPIPPGSLESYTFRLWCLLSSLIE